MYISIDAYLQVSTIINRWLWFSQLQDHRVIWMTLSWFSLIFNKESVCYKAVTSWTCAFLIRVINRIFRSRLGMSEGEREKERKKENRKKENKKKHFSKSVLHNFSWFLIFLLYESWISFLNSCLPTRWGYENILIPSQFLILDPQWEI